MNFYTSELLDLAAKKIVEELQAEFDAKSLNDTSKAKSSISYKIEGNKIIIEGLKRLLFLEFGRRPGKFPPIDVIQKWVERNLKVDPKRSKNVAFLIAKKIAEKGTEILTDRTKGLQIELIIEDIDKMFLSALTGQVAEAITGGLIKEWEK